MSIRRILIVVIAMLGVMALTCAVALIRLSMYLHSTSYALGDAVTGLQLAQKCETLLLLHHHNSDPTVRLSLQLALRRNLSEARKHVTNDKEDRLLDSVEQTMNEYLDMPEESPFVLSESKMAQTYAAFDALVTTNVEQAHAAQAQAATLDRTGTTLGATISLLLLATVGVVWWWLRSAAFKPMLSLANAMERFGKGERDIRARETGPAELREMAKCFNDMAMRIAFRRQEQLALIGAVAHDLRNPMSILMSAAAAFDLEEARSPEAAQQVLAMISRQITRMNRILGDLVDGASIEAGCLELRTQHHDLVQIINEATELYTAPIDSYNLKLSLPEQEVIINCDAGRVIQVLNNLLSNAVKYSPRDQEIIVSLRVAADKAIIEVKDKGVGIAANEIPLLFEPFRRTGSGRAFASGTGLGLYVARRIIFAHNGRIEVDSTAGVGSTFRVILPLNIHAS
ncbi:MAG: HAMP domain-containing histidine kinase [Deltaproteobacteria bacterium]|nr:HAMP domain-containing histidine kinase [Deltaproteobacteria bacterium]